MPLPFDPDDLSRFSDFSIHTTPYKTVGSHAITADVLIPKSLLTSPSPPRPLLVRFHGGGLVGASSLFPAFFAPWMLQLAEREGAVIVSPNYRLLPEASVGDVLADVEDVWRWVRGEGEEEGGLARFVEHETKGRVTVDTRRVMTAGDSAGGYLSVMLALRHPDEIRSATAAYPMLDIRSAHFSTSYAKPMFGLPMQPRALYDAHVAAVRSGDKPGVISADPRCERFELMFCVPQNGICSELFPADQRAWVPFEAVEDGARLPRGGLFVAHGAGDDVVPVEGSRAFERLVRERDGEVRFVLAVREGGHGFDAEASVDDEWMRDGLRGVVQAWLEE
ncbi:Alpha/Beta hydrolase protein [Phyllosticta capitalensis]